MSAAYLGNAAFKAAKLKTCSISPMILLMYWQIPDLDSLEFMPSFPAIYLFATAFETVAARCGAQPTMSVLDWELATLLR